jgi:hypothetical protein
MEDSAFEKGLPEFSESLDFTEGLHRLFWMKMAGG